MLACKKCVQHLCDVFYPADPSLLMVSVSQALLKDSDQFHDLPESVLKNVLENLVNGMKLTRIGSESKRFPRAVLRNSFRYTDISKLKEKLNFTLSKDGYAAGTSDWKLVQEVETLFLTPGSRERYDTSKVDKAVSFILSGRCVEYLSLGSKVVRLYGTKFTLPALTRNISATEMFKIYGNESRKDRSADPVSSKL